MLFQTQRLSSTILRSLNPSSLKEKKQKILNKVKNRYQKINKKIHTSNFMKRRDKMVFLGTILHFMFGSYLLGYSPCSFPYYYIICAIILVPARFINYRIQKYHYFLLDFCYYANILQVIYLYFYSSSQLLFNISFAFACGPLLISIPLFSNSFVPHSVDKMTSLVIHLLPAITLWAIKSADCPVFLESMKPLNFQDFYLYSVGMYLIWIVPYYLVMFWLLYERWQRKQNITLYKWVMENKTTLTYKYCGLLGEKYRPAMFMSQHALSSVALILFAYVQIQYYWVLCGFVGLISCWSIWNGASYYIDLFARRYEKDLERIEKFYKELD